MARRIRRHQDYELVLEIKNEGFIQPPRAAQRNWLLNRMISEFAQDLAAMDQLAARFVPGEETGFGLADRTHSDLADEEIMEAWQTPLMEAMAKIVTESHGDVLEIGFGLGVSASFVQKLGVASHTIIECNDSVVGRYKNWKQKYADCHISLIHSLWQEATDQLDIYDGILFHTYPLNEDEYLENVVQSVTFAEHFFPTAAKHLRPGGVFTYMTNEIDSLSRAHQRLLLEYFESFCVSLVALDLPENVRDAWWADRMAVVKAVK